MTTAELITVSDETIAEMKAAQHEAARQFWAYPNLEWQANFQEHWLLERGFPAKVLDPAGLVYGHLDPEDIE